MLVTGIKSKPVYAPLRADFGGRYHLMLGMGPGTAALLRVLGEMRGTPHMLGSTQILLMPDQAAPHTVEFEHLSLQSVQLFAARQPLLDAFRLVLAEALMGTRLYVSGPENFIGLAMKIALEFDLSKDEIRAEEVGTLARRVYCVHCRSTADDVRTNIVECPGCARWLLVRDHYSRRLAAYMGVMVDAEAPGELPPVREIFL